jgi:hypothetical protein
MVNAAFKKYCRQLTHPNELGFGDTAGILFFLVNEAYSIKG